MANIEFYSRDKWRW